MSQQEKFAIVKAISSMFAEIRHNEDCVWRIDGERIFLSKQPSSWWTYLCKIDALLEVTCGDLSEYIGFLARARPRIWFQYWKEEHITEEVIRNYHGNVIYLNKADKDEIHRWNRLLADAEYRE